MRSLRSHHTHAEPSQRSLYANTNDHKAHAGRKGLVGETVVDSARLGYYMGMGCTTVAVRMLSPYAM